MKKIAIFVEGQTEQLFVTKLIKQIFGEKNVTVETCKFSGKKGSRKVTRIETSTVGVTASYYFIIYDSGGDSTVKSDILENRLSLQKASFSYIIGIRDVYPLTDINKLRIGMKYGVPTSGIPINIILAVNEVEAWFVAEENHYSNISPILTIELVNSIAGIDVINESTETLVHPADMLNTIYSRAGLTYDKSKTRVERTVEALDYANLYFNVRTRNNSFNDLLVCMDDVFFESYKF
jgi:hypothetical protein